MKIKARTINEFSKEIHSSQITDKVKNFSELEEITKNWLQDRVVIDIKRSYQSIVNRGLITAETTFKDWLDKIKEEVQELELEEGKHPRIIEELADIIIVATNMAFHYKIDINKSVADKIEVNEQRDKA